MPLPNRLVQIVLTKKRYERRYLIWTTLLEGASVLALIEFCQYLQESIEYLVLGCFAIFALTDFRFVLGDIRYMWQRSRSPSLSKKRLRNDTNILIAHAVIIVMLAVDLTDPSGFLKAYAILMLVNSIWLLWNYWQERRQKTRVSRSGDIFKLISYNLCHTAGLRWAVNNLIAFALLVAFGLLHRKGTLAESHYLWWSLGVCLLNCLLDIALTHRVYFFRPTQPEAATQQERFLSQ